jgi:wyosine [tRNA(Phe)-imidazoG37] synthetase (radical SAM superfamily)
MGLAWVARKRSLLRVQCPKNGHEKSQERYLFAQVRHCALSLVGEPIMYPEINQLVDLLHARRISTFLVTNAQVGRQTDGRQTDR